MGFYAQQNYLQHLGSSNSVTISEAGCLLTSVSNGLLKMTGSAPDPATLNSFFIGHGAYVWDAADGANDDLTWGSISVYDPSIRLSKVGTGSLPDSNNAIVKFHYNSVHTGRPIDHYCWVDHIEGRDVYIIDSWDGLIKGPGGYQGVYHLPVAWATFERVPVAAPPPPPVTPKFQVTETYPQGRQIRLNKDTNLWGMNYDFDTMVKNPVETGHKAGEVWTVTNKVHHVDGYDYYRRDGQVDGFNVFDCDDYTPPAPYVPPAAPIAVPSVTYYDLLTTVMWFKSDQNALDRYDGQGTIDGGTYVRLKTNGNAVQLTRKNTDTTTYWINSTDNKVPEIPVEAEIEPIPVTVPTLPTDPPPAHDEPVDIKQPDAILTNSMSDVKLDPPLPTAKPQYNWIRDDRLPVRLTSTNSIPVTIADMEGRWPTQPFPAHRTEEYSMYTVVKGKEYWLPDRTRQKGYMYGLSVDFLPAEQPIKPTLLDHNANGRYDIIDIFDSGISGFVDYSSKYLDGLKKAVSTVAPRIEPVRKNTKQLIDGFTSRRKK